MKTNFNKFELSTTYRFRDKTDKISAWKGIFLLSNFARVAN